MTFALIPPMTSFLDKRNGGHVINLGWHKMDKKNDFQDMYQLCAKLCAFIIKGTILLSFALNS